MNQVETGDKLIDVLLDRGIGRDLNSRDLHEAMAVVGIVFTPGSQTEAIAELDALDQGAA